MAAAEAKGGSRPKKFGVVVFPGFQALDAFGPLDILNQLSAYFEPTVELCVLAATRDPVPTRAPRDGKIPAMVQSIVPTHTFADAPGDIEVLLVPGGLGTRQSEIAQPAVNFIRSAFPGLRYLLTVCTGSALAAMAGVLDGRRATSNKLALEWVSPFYSFLRRQHYIYNQRPTDVEEAADFPDYVQAMSQGPKVEWVREARWVTDGNVWTSSGISAGIDMTYAFVADQWGEDVAQEIADRSEYTRQKDSTKDPFAKKPSSS